MWISVWNWYQRFCTWIPSSSLYTTNGKKKKKKNHKTVQKCLNEREREQFIYTHVVYVVLMVFVAIVFGPPLSVYLSSRMLLSCNRLQLRFQSHRLIRLNKRTEHQHTQHTLCFCFSQSVKQIRSVAEHCTSIASAGAVAAAEQHNFYTCQETLYDICL